MRISDRSTIRSFLRNVNNARAASAKVNDQIASGKRFEKMSDNVSAGTRVLRSRMDQYKAETHLDNIKSISSEMQSTEDTMLAISDSLGDLSAIASKAISQGKDSPANPVLATEVKHIRESILQLMNNKFGERYSFGGSNSSSAPPFSTDANGKLLYNNIDVDTIYKDANGKFVHDVNGVPENVPMNEDVYLDVGLGIRMNASQIDDQSGFKLSFSGLEAFGFGVNADGKSNNIFNTLKDLEDNIKTYDGKAIEDARIRLVEQKDKFVVQLTEIGSKTKFLESMEDRLESKVLNYTKGISELMAIDDAESAMDLKMTDFALKAVLQMGARVIPVSLMDFLR